MRFIKNNIKTNKKTNRKRYLSGVMAFVMFISAFSFGGYMFLNRTREAKADVFDSNGNYNILKADNYDLAQKVGSEKNPYVVLEVVPNASMASFGYLVNGQEPIDVEKAINEDKVIAENLGAYVEANDSTNIAEKEFKNLLKENDLEGSGYEEIDTADQYGEFRLAEVPGTGNYVLSETTNEIISEKVEYISVGKGKGDYEPIYEYVGNNRGTHEIDTDENSNGFSGGVMNLGNRSSGYLRSGNGNRTSYSFSESNYGTKYHVIFKEGKNKKGNYSRTSNYWEVGHTTNSNGETVYLGSYIREEQKEISYSYTFNYVESGGDYIFVPKTYKESSDIKNNTELSNQYLCHDGWKLDTNVRLSDDEKKVLKGYVIGVPVMVKYKKAKGYTNTDLFKKFGIGLAYKSNDIEKGEDISKYVFKGWYTEKQCVNKVNEDMRLYKDTTIYAKWVAIYPTDELNEAAGITDPTQMYIPNYSISFDDNAPDSEEIYDMPETIEYIERGKALVAPSLIPKRKGKIFDGWCTDREGNNKYLFSSPVNSNIVLYAKWLDLDDKTFRIEFNSNTPNADDMENVTGMPATIDGYCRNGMLVDYKNAEPAADPVLEGYTFAGWYYNKACTKAFEFTTTLADNIESDVITLYAKWIPNNSKTYRLYFDANKPETAIDEVDTKNYKTTLEANLAGFIENRSNISESIPVLEGNITAKIKKYNVEVITVTPEDLKDKNLALIDRANLIVFNQTVNEQLVGIFDKYKSTARFGSKKYSYTNTSLGGESNSIDLNWEATLRIFKKVAIGSDGKGKDIAPIIFDSNIVKNIATSTLNTTYYTTSDNKVVTMSNSETKNKGKVSSKNIFKLYLLTQQMNPVTFYNAYKNARAGFAELGDANAKGEGLFLSYGNGRDYSTAVWSFKTLFPVEAITESDWNAYNKDNGAASGIAEVLGFNDNPVYDNNCIKNRTLITSNILAEFVNQKAILADEDMREFYKDISGKNSPTYSFDMTDAMYYLTHAKVAITNFDQSLNVLDIEPAGGDDSFKKPSFWFWYISKYIGNFSSNINVTKKSTWEFVGDIDDLNSKYDLIYLGGNISTLHNDYKALLPKNDNDTYYSYAHTGSEKSINIQNAGLLEDNTTRTAIKTFVGSGNDITKKKYEELLTYAKAGYPVVFGRDLLNVSTAINGTVKVSNINTDAVDKASYIYKFMKTLISDSEYSDAAFFENQYNAANAKKFREALEIRKFTITILDKPVEYVDKSMPENADKKAYINENDPNSKALQYRFRIDSNATNTYTVRVYIDTNADGRFVDEEKLDALEIYDSTINRHVRFNKLTGGHTYDVSRVIDDYVGAIPWKLEISDNSNTLARNSITGLCAIKVAEKTKLNILQIVSNKDNDLNTNNLYLPTDEEIASASNNGRNPITRDNWGTYFKNHIKQVNGSSSNGSYLTDSNRLKNSGMFYYYLDQLKEFEVHFDRLTVDEFEKKVNEQNRANSVLPDEEKTDFMDNYNMLILGYADCFSDVEDEACVEINKFINEGNTTLFTHDTTSFFNVTQAEYSSMGMSGTYWGYNINKYFRNILGMDRYDVMTNKGSESKMGNTCDDKPYKAGNEQSENVLHTSGSKVLAQGMTNGVLMGVSGGNLTYEATKTNDGQLVSYPYEIPDSLKIAGTHSQYYQLDLEENDIVVWYSLYDSQKSYYSVKNDVRNNYYIYNKGNITYTGVGHSATLTENEVKLFANTMIAAYNATVQPTVPVITNADKSTDNEDTDYVYVDYDATVSEEDSIPFGNGVFNNMSVDKYGGDNIDTTTKRIYFTLKNNSIVMNKEMTVHYFPAVYDDSTGEFKQLSQFPLPLKTYRIDDDSWKEERTHDSLVQIGEDTINIAEKIFADNESNNVVSLTGGIVESNEEYFVDVPIMDSYYENILYGDDNKTFKALDSENEFAIQIQVIMRYGRDQSANVPLKGFRNVLLMRRGMFSLD